MIDRFHRPALFLDGSLIDRQAYHATAHASIATPIVRNSSGRFTGPTAHVSQRNFAACRPTPRDRAGRPTLHWQSSGAEESTKRRTYTDARGDSGPKVLRSGASAENFQMLNTRGAVRGSKDGLGRQRGRCRLVRTLIPVVQSGDNFGKAISHQRSQMSHASLMAFRRERGRRSGGVRPVSTEDRRLTPASRRNRARL